MPSQYKCDKGHTFIYPAKRITPLFPTELIANLDLLLSAVPNDPELKPIADTFTQMRKVVSEGSFETMVCPVADCHSLTFTLVEEQKPVEAVYVCNLTTGIQGELNTLLKDGWEITGRYAKQYILELKEKPDGDYVAEALAKKNLEIQR